jgi:tetratricopeptide (TPR) repeat protein
MSMLQRFLVALCLLWGSAWHSAALAEATEASAAEASHADESEYRRLVEEALEEYGAQRFEESRALFSRAHALSPNARTHRGLGFVAFELRQYVDCIQHLEAALASPIKPLTGELRTQSEKILARALAFVDRVKLEVTPASARVLVDGSPLETAAKLHDQRILLSIGEHALELGEEGFRSEHRKLVVNGGEERIERAILVRAEASPPVIAEDGRSRAWYKSPWLWTAVGVVAIGAGTGVAIAITRDSTEKPYAGTSNQTLTGP